LEWHSVYVPLTSRTIFPSTRGRGRWTTNAQTLPYSLRGDRDSLPVLGGWLPADRKAFDAEDKADAQMEERRLGYVAYTRAARRLVISGHHWGRTQQKPLGPSEYLVATREWLAEQGREPLAWAEPPSDEATNPHFVDVSGIEWPTPGPALIGRRALADSVRSAAAGTLAVPAETGDVDLARLDELAADVELLLAEAGEAESPLRKVPWPASMSATTAMALQADPEQFARELARPMPRQPSGAARFGTRFHAWVEAHFGQQTLLDPTDLPGRGDVGIGSDAELDEVKAAFLAGPYADLTPVQIEAPFSLVLGGQQFVGRIDAVFSSAPGLDSTRKYEVVDWKTNKQAGADPLQLAIYRLAWAELMGVEPAAVTASFYYARLGEVQTFTDLPDRAELEETLGLGTGDSPIA
jgi:DNA helicase-2/ATP-dependent DNA helicase PcrA